MHKDKKASMLEASMNKFLNGGECANLHLLNLLTIDLCLKVSYWALCPLPVLSWQMAQLFIAHTRNVLLTNNCNS